MAITFYPPNSRPEDDPAPTGMVAQTAEQIEHLRSSGWLDGDQLFAPQRAAEKQRLEAQLREVEKVRLAAEKEQEAERERRVKAAADEKLREEAEEAKRAVISAKEARVNFVVATARSQTVPLWERCSKIGDQLRDIQHRIPHDSEWLDLAKRAVALNEERTLLRAKIEVIDTQLAKDMETAWRQ